MDAVIETIKRLSSANSNVLITGETGTGKELVARAIHFNSPRKNKPFIVVNCAAIPPTLLESELFGHAKGAFTDAWQDKRGRFEDADDGTLFLDEISEMSPATQAKLLRVLQDGEFSRIGENKVRKANVRVLAATNTDLSAAVENGSFRKDLFFRINVLHIHIPPLRERTDDIPILIRHFLDISCKDNNMPLKHFTSEVMRFFLSYGWLGNVRELQNIVERCVLMSKENEIVMSDLPPEIGPESLNSNIVRLPGDEDLSLKRALPLLTETLEKDLIIKALKKANGNKELAAQILEISRRSLFYKLKEYGIN